MKSGGLLRELLSMQHEEKLSSGGLGNFVTVLPVFLGEVFLGRGTALQ